MSISSLVFFSGRVHLSHNIIRKYANVYSKSSDRNISLGRIWDAFIKEIERWLIKLYLIIIARFGLAKGITLHCFKIIENKANKNLIREII